MVFLLDEGLQHLIVYQICEQPTVSALMQLLMFMCLWETLKLADEQQTSLMQHTKFT